MRYFHRVMLPLVAVLSINVCKGYRTLRITDYYWQAESVYEWMKDVYSNDCSFFSEFIDNYLIPMNIKVANSTANTSMIEDHFACDDSEPNSVGMAQYRCTWYDFYGSSECDAYQHYMFEVSKHSRYYDDVKNDSIVDSLLNRTFVHFTMLYNTNTMLNESTDLSFFIGNTNDTADYQSYLTSIGNLSYTSQHTSMYTNNSMHNMSWKLITTQMSMYLGSGIFDVNKTKLSQKCNLIYFDDSSGSCYGLLTLENITSSNYLVSTQFMDSNKTVKCDYYL